MDDDSNISSFLAITGSADVTQATHYLEMSGGSLDMAVSLFLEHNGSAGATSGANVANSNGPAEIRAPDAVQTERLVQHGVGHHPMMMMGMGMGMGGIDNAYLDARAMANQINARRAVWDSIDDSDDEINVVQESKQSDEGKAVDDEDEENAYAGGTRRSSSANATSLSNMFAPPTHLMHAEGGFQGARALAKQSKKWLLVNIQSDTDFACHALNRDVWRDELVINLVQEGFVFWQALDQTSDGMTYCQRYGVHGFPHIAILDPRTGRLMWKKENWTQVNPLLAGDFAQIASDFCSRHSFDAPPRAAPMPVKASNGTTVSNSTNKRPIESLTEDEQLQAAIAASMREEDNSDDMVETSNSNDDDDVLFDTDGDGGDSQEQGVAEEDEKKKASMADEFSGVIVGGEPTNGSRIQFRMPDGKRVIRKFNAEDRVEVLYAFIVVSK